MESLLDDGEGAGVHIHRLADQGDRGALAVGQVDARVVHDYRCAPGALEHDASGWAGHVAQQDAVLPRRLHRDAAEARRQHAGETGNFRRAAPVASDPHREVEIALLEFHPDAGAHRRDREKTALLAANGDTRHGPRGEREVGHIRHDHLNPAALFRIDVVHDHAAVFAVEGSTLGHVVHTGTLGTVESRPLRDSVKSCLYSPRWILWGT